MQINILGTGRVGRTLAPALAAAGHKVAFGSRDPRTKDDLGHSVIDREEAVRSADLVISAVPGSSSAASAQAIGADAFAGKVVLDLGNAVTEHFELMYPNASLGQTLQTLLPTAKVVKSLNTIAAPLMIDPSLIVPSSVFVSGDDTEAKSSVAGVLHDLGWAKEAIVDLGGIESARAPEHYFLMFAALMGATGSPIFNIRVITPEAA